MFGMFTGIDGNNFKEFVAWYDANKKELEANAQKKGPKGKTAAKMAA